MVIGKRGIFLKILPDLLMLIEEMIHILKFLLAKVIVYVASISIAFPNGPAITIGAISIDSIPVHVPGFKLIFPAHERGRIRAHFLPYRRMLTQKLAEILVAFQVALIDRKSTRLNSSHQIISYAVFCLKKKKQMSRS